MIADIIAEDRDGRPVLLVAVRTEPASEAVGIRFLDVLSRAPRTTEFGMLVDPESIRVVRRHDRGEARDGIPSAAEFDTPEVLGHYSSDFFAEAPQGSKRVFHVIMTQLVEVWLWDLAIPWKPGEPPKKAELAAIGLLPLIEGGRTVNRGSLSAHPLR